MSSFTLPLFLLLTVLFALEGTAKDSATTFSADDPASEKPSFRARHDFETYAYKVLNQLEEYTGDSVSPAELKMAIEAVHSTITWIGTNLHLPKAEYVKRRSQLDEDIGHVLAALEEVIDFDKDEL